MKAVVAAFNQEKALVGAFSVITNLRMELFEALVRRNSCCCERNAVQHQAAATSVLVVAMFRVQTRICLKFWQA